MIILNHTRYSQVNTNTWCAIAQVKWCFDELQNIYAPKICHKTSFKTRLWYYSASYTSQNLSTKNSNKRLGQRAAVRLLLQQLLEYLDINDTLDESKYPYRLVKTHYYICFSHSDDTIAVALNKCDQVGVDIENNAVSFQIATRYYHRDEVAILKKLPTVKRDLAVKILWQIKESVIKINNNTLTKGLGISYACLIPKLVQAVNNKNLEVLAFQEADSHYTLCLLENSYAVVVYKNKM